MVPLWAIVRFTFRRTGIGGVLRRMKTRPPRTGDLPEQRVANLVQEVAVAAATPLPRVLLIDSNAANVGAAGLRLDDATVIVTRGFVDRLPRDAQQALIAHVMASVGNGDLTLAAEIMTLLQAWGFVTLVLEAPFLPSARASLRLVGRTAMQTLRGRADASDRELAVDTLLAGAGHEYDIDSDEFDRSVMNVHPLVGLFVYIPLLLTVAPAAIAAKTITWLTVFLTGPLVAVLWRARRWLADATAVQLTRHPEALAQALRTLAGLDMKVPGAVAVHFLFPVWDPAVDRDNSRTDVTSALLHMQLPFESRLRRLQRLGASGERPAGWTPPEEYSLRDIAAAAGWLIVGALFLAVVLALSALGAAAVLYVLGWLLHAVLVSLPRWIAGMGRSFVHSLVGGAGGRVEIDSIIGQGTTVTLILPMGKWDRWPGAQRRRHFVAVASTAGESKLTPLPSAVRNGRKAISASWRIVSIRASSRVTPTMRSQSRTSTSTMVRMLGKCPRPGCLATRVPVIPAASQSSAIRLGSPRMNGARNPSPAALPARRSTSATSAA
jgi:Zn-dependent protease with chaperone function